MIASRAFPFSRNTTSKRPRETTHQPCESKRSLRNVFSNVQRIETPSTATSEPVVIPARSSRYAPRSESRTERRNNARRHLEKLSESTRALLADTAIPPPRFNRTTGGRRSSGQRLTVDAVQQHTRVTEKELSQLLGRRSSYMDLLLSPPDEEDETILSDTGRDSILSSETMSSDSVPSLDDGASPGAVSPSFRSSVVTPSLRGRRSRPTRSYLSLASIAAGESAVDHPLSSPDPDEEDFGFRSPENASFAETCSDTSEVLLIPSRGFKSNITASLRALTMAARSSARSLASFTAPPIMPDDFLHRSIITEPKMPFTDDRMPPVLLDVPTPELRRYLNPITNAPIEAHAPSSKIQISSKLTVTASMQLQTYRLNRASPSQNYCVISLRTKPTPPEPETWFPIVQERGYRDNSDIERRMCFDKLMRQAGKLSENAPSKAYFSYPPRAQSRLPYRINANGIPERWIAITPGQVDVRRKYSRRAR